MHGGVVQGGISRDTWKYEAGVFPVINGKLITGMRKHDSVATLCSAASSGCNAWAQLETLGDDQKPFSLDRAFHAGVVLYGKDRGVDAQGVAYDELGANIPTNGRVVVFGGVRSTRCRAQVEGSGGGSLFVTRAPPGGGRKVGTGGGWGRGCGRGVRVGRRLLLWWRVRRMDVLGVGTMVVVSSLSLCLFINPDPVSLSPPHLPPLPPLLSLLPLLFLRSLLPRTPRTCPLSSFLGHTCWLSTKVDTRGDVTNTIWSMPLKGEETTITTKAENGTSSKTTETHKWQCPSVSAADETGDARDAASCSIPEYQMINGTKVLVESGAVPKILTGAHGTITSGRMVPRMNCLWRIDAPAAPPPKGKKWHIVLNIVEFDLGLKPYGMNATYVL